MWLAKAVFFKITVRLVLLSELNPFAAGEGFINADTAMTDAQHTTQTEDGKPVVGSSPAHCYVTNSKTTKTASNEVLI